MVDTAHLYGNEADVGRALRDSGVPRENVWVTTKLWKDDHGFDSTMQACRNSLRKMGFDYLDLYLIHTPAGGKLIETWDALLELQRLGLARSVGVSNFGVKHLEALAAHGRAPPVVNQIEMHPLVYQERKDLLDYCKQRGILVQAYGSLFAGQAKAMQDSRIMEAAAAHSVSTAQVLLRWGHQMGFQLIPKSTKKQRLAENMRMFDFELSTEEMKSISSMRGNLGSYWNPLTSHVNLGRLDLGKRCAGA